MYILYNDLSTRQYQLTQIRLAAGGITIDTIKLLILTKVEYTINDTKRAHLTE